MGFRESLTDHMPAELLLSTLTEGQREGDLSFVALNLLMKWVKKKHPVVHALVLTHHIFGRLFSPQRGSGHCYMS